ncbi:g7928 [Coccomyxa viridis]|uniref:S-acyltransferase n=1 Tax=Coccomyxa viridis TaxID=1274662 RepID=A0ABP1G3Z1_9CHLO
MPLSDSTSRLSPIRERDPALDRPPAGPGYEERRVVDVLRQARGCQICGVDRTIWIFALAHGGGMALMLLTETDIRRSVTGALHANGVNTLSDWAVTLVLVAAIAAQCYLFARLYRSDPGWVRIGTLPEGPARQKCEYCGCTPPQRSRHDFHTGQCVAKFDHFCPIIATSVGDCNHFMFWLYCVMETFLVLWALGLALDAIFPCLFGDAVSKAVCWGAKAWQSWLHVLAVMLLVPCLNVFGGLIIAHSYLAATGQTSYEIIKGAKVPYLQEHYRRYAGPRGFPGRPRGVLMLARETLRGNAPPAPYSRGLAENLNRFIYSPKPVSYTQTDGPLNSHV